MMTYYKYNPDANNFAGMVVDQQARSRVLSIRHENAPLVSRWEPPTAFVFDEEDYGVERRGPDGDFPSLSSYNMIPVISQRAWDVLEPLIGNVSELLPIAYPDGKPFFLLHVMNTIDALDQERSQVRRSQIGDCRISRIFTYAFKEEMLVDQHIFKLPRMSGGELFIDDDFRRTVEKNGLQGLLFNPLPMVYE